MDMIPKIIHYSWFSDEQMPLEFLQMMETWKTAMPDYEFRLWDANALKDANITFANEAYSVRMWAFAADAIRVYAVYHYGGIWLDGDVAVNKSFDPLLDCRMFIGKEWVVDRQKDGCNHYIHSLSSHCFGAEKGHPYMRECLDYYESRHFILSDRENLPIGLRYDMRLMPYIQALLAMKYGYYGRIDAREKIEVLQDDIHVYPPYYFHEPRYHKLDEAYCVHFSMGSWRVKDSWRPGMDIKKFIWKKNIFYYLYTFINKILAKRRLRIIVRSV